MLDPYRVPGPIEKKLLHWVKVLYRRPKSEVRGDLAHLVFKQIRVSVAALVIMDSVAQHSALYYSLLYTDDVFLAFSIKADLKQLVQKWND